MHLQHALFFTSVCLASPLAAQDGDWLQFRGTNGSSVASETSLPAFGPEEGTRWSTDVPAGHSSPCVVGGRIVLTGFADGKNVLVAIDRATGETAWTKEFAAGEQRPYFHPDAVPALSSPVSDGERVVAYFETYGIVATDLDGKLLWEKRLAHPGYVFGVGGSMLLFDGLLVLGRDGAPEAATLVMDVTDGSEVYRIDRIAFGESHGTPYLWRNADRDEFVIGGSNKVCSYDPGTGELLWFVDGTTSFPCTTPIGDEDTLYFAAWSTSNAEGRSFWEGAFARSLEITDAEVDDPALLFQRLDQNADGSVVPDEVPECRAKDAFGFLDRDQSGSWTLEELLTASENAGATGQNVMVAVARGAAGDASSKVRWTWTRGLPYVASPLLYGGRIWLFKSGGLATCLDAKTGKAIFDRERLSDRSEYYMSPVGVAGKVVVASAEGTVYVLDAKADDLVVEREVPFGADMFATPAIVGDTMYLRSATKLWAFGAPEE